jgi:hypothetical protein
MGECNQVKLERLFVPTAAPVMFRERHERGPVSSVNPSAEHFQSVVGLPALK